MSRLLYAAAAFLATASPAFGTPIVYSFPPITVQWTFWTGPPPSTVNVSLTTDGKLGLLAPADIIGWSWSLAYPVYDSYGPVGASSSVTPSFVGVANLFANGTGNLLDFPGGNGSLQLSGIAANGFFDTFEIVADLADAQVFDRYASNPVIEDYSGPAGAWQPTGVPEPSGIVLIAFGLAIAASGYLCRSLRERHAQARSNGSYTTRH